MYNNGNKYILELGTPLIITLKDRKRNTLKVLKK